MRRFKRKGAPRLGEVAVSIKIRVVSGYFHREHSPRAYELIDSQLAKIRSESELAIGEHESGPELLAYLAVATSGITLAKSVIDLITAIIKARSEGVKDGDAPADPIELIVRRVGDDREFREEIVLRIGKQDRVDAKTIAKQLDESLRRLVDKRDNDS
ncbi:MAG TPA: hypothetical protein VE977_09395 [Pyrinomonadaceae bacterium]|nr:hypothetical protein [Pyrinomonadaceae bacterium]